MSHTDIFEIPTAIRTPTPSAAHTSRFTVTWYFWAATAPLLALGLTAWPRGIAAAIMLADIQILYLLMHRHRPESFPVQVRIAYLVLLMTGCLDGMGFILWLQLVGTVATVTVDYCPLARILSLAPWNGGGWNDPKAIWARMTTPPRPGSVLEAAD